MQILHLAAPPVYVPTTKVLMLAFFSIQWRPSECYLNIKWMLTFLQMYHILSSTCDTN